MMSLMPSRDAAPREKSLTPVATVLCHFVNIEVENNKLRLGLRTPLTVSDVFKQS